jgi:5-dehydro-4-deoxyglucarate dehydratase
MRIVGRDAGPVRSPLTDLSAAEDEQLRVLIERVAPKALAAAA